jgi:ribosome-binding ATPase YchF (GTP1/OBG family)
MDAQDFRSLQEAYIEVVEGFRDLPVEKMKKKEDSLRSKNTSSGERVRSNIENVRTNIGKSQKTQSFGKSEISKKTSAKHHAAGFLRHAPWSPQDTPEKPDQVLEQKKDILNKERVGKEFNKKVMIYTTSSSHTYLMKDMLKHQKQQKQSW